MNKYQKQKSREIKQIMREDRFGNRTYKQARRSWSLTKRFCICRPCEDCDNSHCSTPERGGIMPIVYCPKNT